VISNPFDSPFFLPSVWRAVGILGPALLLLLAIVHFNLRRLRANVLFKRWLVWTIIAPIYLLAVLCGQLSTMVLLTLLIFQGLREYSRLVRLPAEYETVLVGLGLLAAPAALLSANALYLLPPLLFMVGTLQPLFFRQEPGAVRNLAFAALGWGYIAWFLGHLMLLDKYIKGGPGILLALGLGIALTDVGAFTIGKLLGRHQLAPNLSPNKTWEGVAGNVLGAYLGLSIMSFALPDAHRWLLLATLPLVIALGALWGDLLESSMKREFEVKDAGTWLPGFGGLLDRIDSLLIVAPLAYYFLNWLR
jgi:phosphatidate cytidylyltransferase